MSTPCACRRTTQGRILLATDDASYAREVMHSWPQRVRRAVFSAQGVLRTSSKGLGTFQEHSSRSTPARDVRTLGLTHQPALPHQTIVCSSPLHAFAPHTAPVHSPRRQRVLIPLVVSASLAL